MKVKQKSIAQLIEDLKESEQYNRMLFEESTIGLVLCRMNGDLVDINPAFASILGRTIEETMKLSYWDITPEKYTREEQRQLELLEQAGRYGPYEKEYIHADGHLVPVRLSGQILEKYGENFIWSSAEDITERKQAEEAMRRSEVLELLAAGAPLNEILTALVINAEKHNSEMLCSVLLLDHDGNRLRYGAAPSLTDFYSKAIVGEEIGPEVASCGAAAHSGKRVIVEDIMAHPNWESGRELAKNAGLGACWSEPVISSTGDILGTFAIYYREPRAPQQQDLDFIHDSARLAGIAIEKKQAEEALWESEERFRSAFEQAAVGIAHVSLDGAFQRINRRFCDMLGYSKEEMFSKTFQDITHPDDLEADLDYFRQMLAAEIEFYSMEKRYICKDQSVIWVNLTVAIQNDEKGTPKYFVSAVENITERKQAEEALRASEQKYRSVVENIGIGVSIISPDMEILSLNKQMKAWFPDIDVSTRPVCYRSFNNPPRETKCSYCQTKKTLVDGRVYEAVTETPAGDKIFNYRIVSSPIKDENGKVIAAIEMVEDITERKQAEERMLELLQQNRDLTQRLFNIQEQERRHLARELHDEFGQLITVITLHAQIMKGICGHCENDTHESIKIIEGASRQMHQGLRQMIHQLRPVMLDEIGLKDSLQELVDQWQAHCPQTDCVLGMEGRLNDFNGMVNVTVYRIVQESLTNVTKYAEADNVLIQLRRHTVPTEDIDCLFLNIEDDGIGMSLDKPGQGFGIVGMRERVLAVGGEFELKSSPGAGVHIEVQLPIST